MYVCILHAPNNSYIRAYTPSGVLVAYIYIIIIVNIMVGPI